MRQHTQRPFASAASKSRVRADAGANRSNEALPLVLLGPGGVYSYAVEGGTDDAVAMADLFATSADTEPTHSSWSLEFLVSLTGLARTTAVFALRIAASVLAMIPTVVTIAIDLVHRGAARLADITDRATSAMPRGPKPALATGFAPIGDESPLPRAAPRPTSTNHVDAVSLELRRAMETLRPPLVGAFSAGRTRTVSNRINRGAEASSSPSDDLERRRASVTLSSRPAAPRSRAAASHTSSSTTTSATRGTRHESHSQATSHSPDHSRLATSLWRLADDARDRVASRREQGDDL